MINITVFLQSCLYRTYWRRCGEPPKTRRAFALPIGYRPSKMRMTYWYYATGKSLNAAVTSGWWTMVLPNIPKCGTFNKIRRRANKPATILTIIILLFVFMSRGVYAENNVSAIVVHWFTNYYYFVHF